jgi:hypothetical protein
MVTNMQFSCIVKQMKAIIPVSILAGNNRNAISSLAQEKTFFFWGGGGCPGYDIFMYYWHFSF